MQVNNSLGLQGSFSFVQKNESKKNNDKKENASQSATDKTLKMIEKLEEQIKKVNENQAYDYETKKDKIRELSKQIEEIKEAEKKRKAEELEKEKEKEKTENEEKDKKVNSDNNVEEEVTYSENAHGDKLTLSDDMKEMLNKEKSLKELEEKHDAKKALKNEARVLEREIDVDRGRATNPEKKVKRLNNLEERIEDLDENKQEKVTDREKENSKVTSPTSEKTGNNINDLTEENAKLNSEEALEENNISK